MLLAKLGKGRCCIVYVSEAPGKTNNRKLQSDKPTNRIERSHSQRRPTTETYRAQRDMEVSWIYPETKGVFSPAEYMALDDRYVCCHSPGRVPKTGCCLDAGGSSSMATSANLNLSLPPPQQTAESQDGEIHLFNQVNMPKGSIHQRHMARSVVDKTGFLVCPKRR